MKSPAFQFYAADFLSDMNTIVMSAEEVGAYWLLICVCWREGYLPDDCEELATLSRVPLERFQASWDKRIKRCFEKNEDGTWSHRRLNEERDKQAANREKKQAAANKRHHPEDAPAMQPQCTSNADAEQMQCPSSSSSTAYTPNGGAKPPNTIWDLGVPLLANGGMKESEARSLLGKMAKDYSRTTLAEAIAKTSAANPPDPKTYLVKVLQDNGKPKERGVVI